jgi:hypothetical protein
MDTFYMYQPDIKINIRKHILASIVPPIYTRLASQHSRNDMSTTNRPSTILT